MANTRDIPKATPEVWAEIRVTYSKYLKDASPAEQEKAISMIAAAEKKLPRSKVQEKLDAAIGRCFKVSH
jgi:hypothetical protein